MGAKYELKFLTDASNEDSLLAILDIMLKDGWTYNKLCLGRYAYWQEGPIWKFGNSVDFTEKHLDEHDNTEKLQNIIKEISKFYSPTIFFNKVIFNKISTTVIAIIESQVCLIWKEALVAFELADLLQLSNELETVSNEIKEIFLAITKQLKPYYALASTELGGLVDEPRLLKINREKLADFNYFSKQCFTSCQVNFAEAFETIDFENRGKFIFTEKIIGKL